MHCSVAAFRHRGTYEVRSHTQQFLCPGELPRHLIHGQTHTHPFNGALSGTTRVGWYQKGKTNMDFTEARDSDWQWHQLRHMHNY